MKLQEYVQVLQEWLGSHPEAADLGVVIREEGYYSDSPFAELYDKPEIERISVRKLDEKGKPIYEEHDFFGGKKVKIPIKEFKEYVVLGCSVQNY